MQLKLVLDALQDAEHGVIKSTDEIAAVGHRVLHAGEKYIESCLVTEDVKKVVRECFDLGPLHNPANLIGIEAVEAAMPRQAKCSCMGYCIWWNNGAKGLPLCYSS